MELILTFMGRVNKMYLVQRVQGKKYDYFWLCNQWIYSNAIVGVSHLATIDNICFLLVRPM